jgi:hypothetical protein
MLFESAFQVFIIIIVSLFSQFECYSRFKLSAAIYSVTDRECNPIPVKEREFFLVHNRFYMFVYNGHEMKGCMPVCFLRHPELQYLFQIFIPIIQSTLCITTLISIVRNALLQYYIVATCFKYIIALLYSSELFQVFYCVSVFLGFVSNTLLHY